MKIIGPIKNLDGTLLELNWQDAMNYAKFNSCRLPSKEEFEELGRKGLRFNGWFWSSSIINKDRAYFFGGFSGYIGETIKEGKTEIIYIFDIEEWLNKE